MFNFGSGADFKDAKIQIGFANQSGLGLPTPDYYTDPKQADLRDAYKAYIAKIARSYRRVGRRCEEAGR